MLLYSLAKKHCMDTAHNANVVGNTTSAVTANAVGCTAKALAVADFYIEQKGTVVIKQGSMREVCSSGTALARCCMRVVALSLLRNR